MSTPTGHTQYDLFGYSGESMFEATVPARGTYHFACDGDRGVIAIGSGLGTALLLLILSGIGALIAAVALIGTIAAIRWKRRPT